MGKGTLTGSTDQSQPTEVLDTVIDEVHGGAWSLGLRDISVHGFNPQPEPPAEPVGFSPTADLTAKGFNPQPEPPAKSKLLRK